MSIRIGVVSAFPPGRNSLNEFGFHLVKHMAQNDEISEVVLFADETDAGPPTAIDGVVNEVCWGFNRLGNVASIAGAIRRTRPDAVLLNLQFATFGESRPG